MLGRSPTVFILNAGDGARWRNFMGGPKQLATINGEAVLERTVRMLRRLGASDITSVCNDARLAINGCRQFRPAAYRWIAETLLSATEQTSLWTIVLLGDVFFTESALRAILQWRRPIRVFGRSGPNHFNGRNHGEIFGMSFDATGIDCVRDAATRVVRLSERGAWGNLWDVYHVMVGLPLRSADVEDVVFKEIHDLTDDFDTPEDYLASASLWGRYMAETDSGIAHPALLPPSRGIDGGE